MIFLYVLLYIWTGSFIAGLWKRYKKDESISGIFIAGIFWPAMIVGMIIYLVIFVITIKLFEIGLGRD